MCVRARVFVCAFYFFLSVYLCVRVYLSQTGRAGPGGEGVLRKNSNAHQPRAGAASAGLGVYAKKKYSYARS